MMVNRICFVIIGVFIHTIVAAQQHAHVGAVTKESKQTIRSSNHDTSIKSRTILIGDAGEITGIQQAVIAGAVSNIIPYKTTVLFLGDNIYSRGMALEGARELALASDILKSQYGPMRAKGAKVLFIPGNHDWDKLGPKGLAKIKAQWQFIADQKDSLLQLLPPDGCPDPIAVDISDNVTLILFDSEWWLYPQNKNNPDETCDCMTKKDVIQKLEALVYENRSKFIILAGHHPFISLGVHGGHYSWKDHIFPLRAANKKLYIPLPGIGSLYPILRKLFSNPEDLNHPLYREMSQEIQKVFANAPNWVYVSGHDHGLQYLQKKHLVQVVSGAGSRIDYVKKASGGNYAHQGGGFVIADELMNKEIRYTFFKLDAAALKRYHVAMAANKQRTGHTLEAKINTLTPPAILDFTAVQPIKDFAQDSVFIYKPIEGDSVLYALRPKYDSVGRFHRFLFGENYRKEYAAKTTYPILRISELAGGLTPTKRGGGMQSTSLRLEDTTGNEYVLRSVLKSSDALLPEALRTTFAKDWVDDVLSGQHPFAALIIPPIATAIGLPHAKPIIGYVAPDSMLGIYHSSFANTVALFEARNPIGKSDNSLKMVNHLLKDNDNTFDATMYLRAQVLDLLVGDWDRHEDQWRWRNVSTTKDKFFLPIPRDRDQALHKTEGVFPILASRQWLLPTFQGFGPTIPHVKYSLLKTKFLNAHPATFLSYERYIAIVKDFVATVTDEVLADAVKQLPATAYTIRGEAILQALIQRRNALPRAMEEYYKFTNTKVDIRLSNKNESIKITQGENKNLLATVLKINKEGILKDTLLSHQFNPTVTKEIRLYLSDGADSVAVDYINSPIKVRIIGGKDKKHVTVKQTSKRIRWYGLDTGTVFTNGLENQAPQHKYLKMHLGKDSTISTYIPTNLYNIWMPKSSININLDDGLLIGVGFQYTHKSGFRKLPYTHRQQFVLAHSFSTNAYKVTYKGEWVEVLGNADIVVNAAAKAPNNTINYFGQGNHTVFLKQEGYKRFYRTRFSLFQLDPAIRWDNRKGVSLKIGPSLQYYRFEAEDSIGRFISKGEVGTYDSATVTRSKWHAGIIASYEIDTRNRPVLTKWGYFLNIVFKANEGVNKYSKAYMQLTPDITFYKSLTGSGNIVLANRIGGTITYGDYAFYQSAFLGGQGNLLGYRQFRFAGQHSAYNNTELRIKLADIANYILPGEFGMNAFFDTGRVWRKNESSQKWHTSYGLGVYFAPASIAVVNFVMGKSNEGWYPTFTMGMRF